MFGIDTKMLKDLKNRPSCPFRVAGDIANAKHDTTYLGCTAEQCMLGCEVKDRTGEVVGYKCALGAGLGAAFHV